MMRNKDYFKEMGLDPANLGKSLDAASDHIFMFNRFPEEETLFRFKSRKVKYRVVSQQKRTENTISY